MQRIMTIRYADIVRCTGRCTVQYRVVPSTALSNPLASLFGISATNKFLGAHQDISQVHFCVVDPEVKIQIRGTSR